MLDVALDCVTPPCRLATLFWKVDTTWMIMELWNGKAEKNKTSLITILRTF